MNRLDELHVVMPGFHARPDASYFKHTKIITYSDSRDKYLVNTCLKGSVNSMAVVSKTL